MSLETSPPLFDNELLRPGFWWMENAERVEIREQEVEGLDHGNRLSSVCRGSAGTDGEPEAVPILIPTFRDRRWLK